ncbi:heme ABC transporter ATP-binding protein [Diaphorobacter ruginosibacter]|uniref:Heme ABC transporter ATP-binding protein n=1 Tax=Diaphorobacter ruginosibacter TaxID=1715720 RepID=A0A7G9RSD9_9BURK|nr:heme ABC transporter ATP-binding protein [Diaphorobacter ruginosibacter]QNN58514.1 heme ABC transporter ATP-binding protein [Diaphorobacter ruginosibacter]
MKTEGIECRALGVGIARGPRLATVTARIEPGRFTAILGPNGAGKSTLLSMLVGEREPQSGEVMLDGTPLARHGMDALAMRRAVMPQDCSVAFDFTALEVVELGRYPHRAHPSREEAGIVRQAMELTGVEHLAHRSINTLSGGERARTHLARALAQVWEPCRDGSARWLLLDEPTAALDLAHQHHSMALLRRLSEEQGVGVVAVVHDVNLAVRYAHDALLVGPGHCTSGAVGEVLEPECIHRTWGVHCTPVRAQDGVMQFLFSARAA